jgi:SAM-dependent methyltransferase
MPASSNPTQSPQAYWDATAETYDRAFTSTLIGQLWRDAVWRELDRGFHVGQRVLELNCGTGIDAVHLASRGIRVLACDISPRMIELARQRASTTGVGDCLDFRVLATEEIGILKGEGPFDGAFSNFSGLNCVEELSAVRRNLAGLLKPRAPVFLCMLGRFVPWEILWYLAHEDRKKAFRRFERGGISSCEGTPKVQYPSRKEITRSFAPEFRLRKWRGIGIALPPSYLEHWARRFPQVMRVLAPVDREIGRLPRLRSMANLILLGFERTETSLGK